MAKILGKASWHDAADTLKSNKLKSTKSKKGPSKLDIIHKLLLEQQGKK